LVEGWTCSAAHPESDSIRSNFSRTTAGTHEVTFDASGLSSGVYFDCLQTGDYVETRGMVIVK